MPREKADDNKRKRSAEQSMDPKLSTPSTVKSIKITVNRAKSAKADSQRTPPASPSSRLTDAKQLKTYTELKQSFSTPEMREILKDQACKSLPVKLSAEKIQADPRLSNDKKTIAAILAVQAPDLDAKVFIAIAAY
jgi:hypothetical protein